MHPRAPGLPRACAASAPHGHALGRRHACSMSRSGPRHCRATKLMTIVLVPCDVLHSRTVLYSTCADGPLTSGTRSCDPRAAILRGPTGAAFPRGIWPPVRSAVWGTPMHASLATASIITLLGRASRCTARVGTGSLLTSVRGGRVGSYRLQVRSYKLQATRFKLQATSYRL